MASRESKGTRARLRREICDTIDEIGSVDNCNILATIDAPETCTSPPALKQRLHRALAVWFTSSAAEGLDKRSLVYDFGGYGSGEALAPSALSPGGEATQFHCLRTVAGELNCEIFLIKLKREDFGSEGDFRGDELEESDSDEDEEEEEDSPKDEIGRIEINERTWTAEVLVDWCSNFKLDGYPLEGDVIVQDTFDMDSYDVDEPDDTYDTRPWDPYYFRRQFTSTAALIIPKASLIEFLCQLSLYDDSSSSVSQLVSYMAAKCRDPERGHRHIHDLFALCTGLSSNPNQLGALDEETIIEVLQLAINNNFAQLFDLISTNINITLTPKRFFTWAGEYLRNVAFRLGPLILAIRRSLSVTRQCGDWYICIACLKTSEVGTPEELREFAQVALSEAALFCSQGDAFGGDGEALVLIACRFKSFSWLLNDIVPIVRRRVVDFAFTAAFCWTLYTAAARGELPKEKSLELLRSLVASLDESFDIIQLVSRPVYYQRRPQAVESHMPLPPPPVSSDTLMNLLRLIVAVSPDHEVRSFLSKVTEQVKLVDLKDFAGLYLPLLNDLMGLAELESDDLGDSPYASLAREIVMEYWQQQYAMAKPQPQPSPQVIGYLNMMLVRCGCSFCRGLMQFLLEAHTLPQAVFGSVITDRAMLIHMSVTIKQCAGLCDYQIEHIGLYCKWWLTKKGFVPLEEQNSRLLAGRAALGKVNQRQLAKLLGAELYGEIMGMSPPSSAALSYETSGEINFLSHGLP